MYSASKADAVAASLPPRRPAVHELGSDLGWANASIVSEHSEGRPRISGCLKARPVSGLARCDTRHLRSRGAVPRIIR